MRLALAQTEPLWENKEGNFRAALGFLEQAREKGADMILFPEMSMTGFSMHPEKIGETREDSVTLRFFQEQAGKYGLHIGIGYVEYCLPKSYNRYAIISPSGEILADYRKIHPFTFGTEAVHYAGGSSLAFCQVKEFTVSPLICYDLRFPELFEIASERAELIANAEFFIGLGSGLSWLAWCCRKPVVLISGFSLPEAEFYTPYRIINFNVCHGCYSDTRYQFDHREYDWCPKHRNTPRHYECTRCIGAEEVIRRIRTIPEFQKHQKKEKKK